MKSAKLKDYNIEKDRLFFEVEVVDRIFTTSIWYKDVDLNTIQDKIGEDSFNYILAHILAFEVNKYGSLHIESIDLGFFKKYVDEDLKKIWSIVFQHIWAQWRFENNLPNEEPPELIIGAAENNAVMHSSGSGSLAFFGGGKDSLILNWILKNSNIQFDILSYSNSIYGNRSEQIDSSKLAQSLSPHSRIKEIAVFDDFLDSPVVDYDGDFYKIHTLTAAETPASLFQSLIFALNDNYGSVILGHEKSANFPNLLWDKEGNHPVNHQWGKSLEAQKLLSEYIERKILNNFHYFSSLMPLSDPAIFVLLNQLPWEDVKLAHSCNVRKPWCKSCPKCAYVWLFYLAFLDSEKVTEEIFDGDNLFEDKNNQSFLRMLAGKTTRTPFECVGQPAETLLALAICRKKGMNYPIINELLAGSDLNQHAETIERQLVVDFDLLSDSNIPKQIISFYNNQIAAILEQAKTDTLSLLSKAN